MQYEYVRANTRRGKRYVVALKHIAQSPPTAPRQLQLQLKLSHNSHGRRGAPSILQTHD